MNFSCKTAIYSTRTCPHKKSKNIRQRIPAPIECEKTALFHSQNYSLYIIQKRSCYQLRFYRFCKLTFSKIHQIFIFLNKSGQRYPTATTTTKYRNASNKRSTCKTPVSKIFNPSLQANAIATPTTIRMSFFHQATS